MKKIRKYTLITLIVLVSVVASEAQKIVLELPQSFIDEIITREELNPGREFWHPALTARKVAVPSPLGSKKSVPSREQMSFLELSDSSSSTTTLEFVTTDGSDASSKLSSASGQKLACECRFVRDYSSDTTTSSTSSTTSSSTTTSSFIQKGPSPSKATRGGGVFMQETSYTNKGRRSDPEPATIVKDISMNDDQLVDELRRKYEQEQMASQPNAYLEGNKAMDNSATNLIEQLSELLNQKNQRQNEPAPSYNQAYRSSDSNYQNQFSQIAELLGANKRNEPQYQPPQYGQRQESNGQADFIQFLNLYEQYQKYENSKKSYYGDGYGYNGGFFPNMNQREAPKAYYPEGNGGFNQLGGYGNGNYQYQDYSRDMKYDQLSNTLSQILANSQN